MEQSTEQLNNVNYTFLNVFLLSIHQVQRKLLLSVRRSVLKTTFNAAFTEKKSTPSDQIESSMQQRCCAVTCNKQQNKAKVLTSIIYRITIKYDGDTLFYRLSANVITEEESLVWNDN